MDTSTVPLLFGERQTVCSSFSGNWFVTCERSRCILQDLNGRKFDLPASINCVDGLAVSEDGRFVIDVGYGPFFPKREDYPVIAYAADTGAKLWELATLPAIGAAQVTPRNIVLLPCSGAVLLIRLKTGEIVSRLTTRYSSPSCVEASATPDGRLVVVTEKDMTINRYRHPCEAQRVTAFDAAKGEVVWSILSGEQAMEQLRCVDNQTVAAWRGNEIVVFDVLNPSSTAISLPPGHAGGQCAFQMDADTRSLWFLDNRATLWFRAGDLGVWEPMECEHSAGIPDVPAAENRVYALITGDRRLIVSVPPGWSPPPRATTRVRPKMPREAPRVRPSVA